MSTMTRTTALPIGSNVGDYLIRGLIGYGSAGRVYAALDQRTNTPVAIKLLTSNDPTVVAYFTNEEALLRAAAVQPDVPPSLMRYVSSAMTEGAGRPKLIITEYVHGLELSAYTGRRAYPPAWVLRVGRDIAQALHYLHTQHPQAPVIHRDVKPGNIRITPEGGAVLLDLGAARHAGFARRAEAGLATPAYAAPEQLRGEEVVASDQWGLALTLLELLIGHTVLPRNGRAAERALHSWVAADRPLLPTAPTLTPTARAVFARALHLDPQERYADALSFVGALQGALQIDDHSVASATPPAPPRGQWLRRNVAPLVGQAALLVVLLLGSGVAASGLARVLPPAAPPTMAAAQGQNSTTTSLPAALPPADATAVPQVTAAPAVLLPPGETVVPLGGGCALRDGSSWTARWVGTNLPAGVPLNVLVRENGWVKVLALDGTAGWCPQTQLEAGDGVGGGA